MIKPLFHYSIDIKSHSFYRDLLKRRPKRPRQFKFSVPQAYQSSQMQLLKALRILKPAYKVDLRDCKSFGPEAWEPKVLKSAYKKISHLRTICLVGSKSDFEENVHFKHFPQLRNLLYELESYRLQAKLPMTHSPLKSLQCCPNIRAIDYANLSTYSANIGFGTNRHFRLLESFVFRNDGKSGGHFNCPIAVCKNLKSVALKSPTLDAWLALPKTMDDLSNLQYLQDIELGFLKDARLDFSEALKKIANRGVLKKVKLEFGNHISKVYKFLEALETCRLTHFSLTAFIEEGLLSSITKLLQNMNDLESLELRIRSTEVFSRDDNFMEVCKQIRKLQELRNLVLDFNLSNPVQTPARIPNFVPELYGLLNKTRKMEKLDIECEQLDASSALQSVISALTNSGAFLTHLKIGFGDFSCSKKDFQALRQLLKSIPNIQVLEIPGLTVNGTPGNFLNELAWAVYRFRYLRVFEIGKLKYTVSLPAFKQIVEVIASKRGLREFRCWLSCGLQKNWAKEPGTGNPNMKRIIKKNPHIEVLMFKESYRCTTLYPHK